MPLYSERFWEKVDRRSENECWPWTGSKNSDGYGQIGRDGKVFKAHREAYRLVRGSFPTELCIIHKCDNPSCVNPFHLTVATHAENMQDKRRKNRQWVKISNRQSVEILCLSGIVSQRSLANIFGLNPSQVSRIISGERRAPLCL